MALNTNTNDYGLGAVPLADNRCAFRVWAPQVSTVDLHILSPEERVIPMVPDEQSEGYFATVVDGVTPGTRYLYRLDGEKERPDPASRLQPDGVHTASEVLDPRFAWNDQAWVGIPLHDYIIYELHIGTFTAEGTFDAAIAHLDTLKDLGVTAIEVMPVAAFPGSRNWGYDGTHLFSVHAAYGGPDGLKRFVDACHQRGLAVVLDVVYNHLGPEGNYLWDYAGPPYFFTNRYQTPWGAAVNFDGAHNGEVRRFFIENALQWVTDYHIDALRLDAVHAMTDFSAKTFMEELATAVRERAEQQGRRIYTIAESDQSDPRLLRPPVLGGYGFDSQWNDDVHHAIHTLLTGELAGYYEDFGLFEHLVRAFRQGWVYAGDYSPHRKRRHGAMPHDIESGRLVACIQNHDQVGNRMLGERLTSLVSFDALKLAASTLLLSPYIPLLFMGEEYGEPAPFLYFVSHGDPDLVEAVRQGRKKEFSSFAWKGEPPDPQAEATFQRSRIDHSLRTQGKHAVLHALYRELLHLRKSLPALANLSRDDMDVWGFEPERVLMLHRRAAPRQLRAPLPAAANGNDGQGGQAVVALFAYHSEPVTVTLPFPAGEWHLRLNTANTRWSDPNAAGANEPVAPNIPDHISVAPAPERQPVTLTLPPYTGVLFRLASIGTQEATA